MDSSLVERYGRIERLMLLFPTLADWETDLSPLSTEKLDEWAAARTQARRAGTRASS